ncbi:hypothetical protein [Blastococcus sp. CCUG 61487]|uniref:hypothetical protein n=1 Tax=Blastococcus sp. CCUG 61487 TaxID=1840703 RepID=UPI0010BFEFD6|nr:hypothetical protein [Blastococcus sp. CCUG 61487]TKJ29189.1 hypothetical protein A6V29_19540 [Blastococcus sp. CCUG 61487]
MSDTHYQAVLRTFPTLDEWSGRLGSVYTPKPGSDLAADDADWPALSLSQIAVGSMGAARDHLQAVRVLIEAREVFPYAQASLVRTALLSAAQAVWLLAPDDRAERLKNARTLTAHIYEQHLRFLRDLQDLASSPHAGTDAVEQHVTTRSQQLAQQRAADGQKAKFNATEVVQTAALAAWGKEDLAKEVKAEWRSGSGAAHGLLWSVFGRAGTRMTGAEANGMAVFQAGGAIDDFANAYFAAYHLLRHAFTLLERRGGS